MSVDRLLISWFGGGFGVAEDLFPRKKAKKHKKFCLTPLQRLAESSIIGLTLREGVAEAREAAGKIEGIGDVLSDGSKRFLGIVN